MYCRAGASGSALGSAGMRSNSPASTRIFTIAGAARRSRSNSCGCCGRSRMSRSRASGTRSRMPGSNPRPASGKVPLWYGGHAEVTLRRTVKWGDGWMPLAYGPGEEARAAFDRLRHMAEEAGRDPATIGIDTRVSAAGEEAEWRDTVGFWKSCGVTHLTLANYYQSGHLRRIEGRSLSDHIAAMRRYWNAVADLL